MVEGYTDDQKMFQAAEQNMQKKINYDKNRAPVRIKIRDSWVLLKSHPLSNMKEQCSTKLVPKWKGPYVVSSRLSPTEFCD
ncbi:hypothetical protein HOLleu_41313 [Holothuria leucospilota]|uniref:Uncharacterized protein n=1 Tax=Holothuria leucospilota TaxID=206669 RepID=A0A9Q0YBP7_HOLLE|nr:hypothetical protein HOLleu_41313 [Holothuria leucospilota]